MLRYKLKKNLARITAPLGKFKIVLLELSLNGWTPARVLSEEWRLLAKGTVFVAF